MDRRENPDRRHFEIRSTSRTTLVLSGCIDGSTSFNGDAARTLRAVAKHHRATIEASDASVLDGGADAWIRIVKEHFGNCELHYRPSQLGMVLRFDDEYLKVHPASMFDDD
jgi:hypothetical protein